MPATNITTNATTLVKSGAAFLNRIVINDVGAASNTAAVYDGIDATGKLLGTVDTVELNGRVLEYGVDCKTGITVVTATGTAGNLTVVFDQENR